MRSPLSAQPGPLRDRISNFQFEGRMRSPGGVGMAAVRPRRAEIAIVDFMVNFVVAICDDYLAMRMG